MSISNAANPTTHNTNPGISCLHPSYWSL